MKKWRDGGTDDGLKDRRTKGRTDRRTKGHPHKKGGSNEQMKEREGRTEGAGMCPKTTSTAGPSFFISCCEASLKESHHVQFVRFQDALGSLMNIVLISGWDMSPSVRPER